MPELPEVETIRRIVERELVGRILTGIDLTLPKLLRDSPMPTLDLLLGRTLESVDRRAKVLVTNWSGDLSVLTHFKLAGQLAVRRPDGTMVVAGHPVPNPEGDYPHKATHLTLQFDDGTIVYYSDIRQFGWWRLMPTEDVPEALAAFQFGPEGIDGDGFDRDEFANRLARRRIAIKPALLDQRVVAGLGNIYVDEALHRAHIHPATPANRLTGNQIDALHEAIGWALERGIEQGGAEIRHGKAYPRDGFPAIHAREGEPCMTCGTAIVKTTVGGRGTYFCPTCQPVPGV
jgi:formamidopyrimidine-DNA glycosylase